MFQGRLEGQAEEIDGYILINDMPDEIEPVVGEIYDVKITEALDYDLVGEIVGRSYDLKNASAADYQRVSR